MNKYLSIILLLFSAQSQAETDWYRVAANTTLAIDWLQTHEIATNNDYYEMNKILGKYPSTGDVNRYFAASMLLTNVIGELLGKYSDYFYISVAVVETKVILGNYTAGIRIKL